MAKFKCLKCGKLAVWMYMPGGKNYCYCDECVPRGCTCQEDKNEPCCEYWYDKNGWNNEP